MPTERASERGTDELSKPSSGPLVDAGSPSVLPLEWFFLVGGGSAARSMADSGKDPGPTTLGSGMKAGSSVYDELAGKVEDRGA
jgi:hypothetical protein